MTPKALVFAALLPLAIAAAAAPAIPLPPKDAIDRLSDAAAFDTLAAIENGGRFLELPRVIFAIDRGATPVRVHWVDPDRAILSDALVRRLAKIGLAIEANFGSRPQDIEWVVAGDRIMIVQARDYVRGS